MTGPMEIRDRWLRCGEDNNKDKMEFGKWGGREGGEMWTGIVEMRRPG